MFVDHPQLNGRVWKGGRDRAHERARVWELFHRVPGVVAQAGAQGGLPDDAARPGAGTPGTPGTSSSLGLHISKAIIQAHGGRVGVTSVVGQGSIFWFTLPLAHTDMTTPKTL